VSLLHTHTHTNDTHAHTQTLVFCFSQTTIQKKDMGKEVVKEEEDDTTCVTKTHET
jgi:hypothetical protein